MLNIFHKLVFGNSDEILTVKVIDSNDPSWAEVKISHPQMVQWAKTKVHVFSAVKRLKGQLKEFQTDVSEQFYGIDKPIELDWNIFKGLTSLELLREIQEYLESRNIDPGEFGDRIISMSTLNDIIWTRKIMRRRAFQIPKTSGIMRRDSCQDIGRSLDLKVEKGGID